MDSVPPSQGIWTWCQKVMLGTLAATLSIKAKSIEVVDVCLCTRGHVKAVVREGDQCAFGYEGAT